MPAQSVVRRVRRINNGERIPTYRSTRIDGSFQTRQSSLPTAPGWPFDIATDAGDRVRGSVTILPVPPVEIVRARRDLGADPAASHDPVRARVPRPQGLLNCSPHRNRESRLPKLMK